MSKLVSVRAAMSGLLFLIFLVPTYTLGKEAEPMAEDPELEKVVNKISAELRCLVCQNQTIADSHAGLAVDLKNQVREMVKAGKTRDQIVDYMVERYGDFVRYRPPIKPTTYLLWIGPFLLFIGGLTLLFFNLKKRREIIEDVPLSDEESSRLKSLLSKPESESTKSAEESNS